MRQLRAITRESAGSTNETDPQQAVVDWGFNRIAQPFQLPPQRSALISEAGADRPAA
jgi:hypothetical protein